MTLGEHREVPHQSVRHLRRMPLGGLPLVVVLRTGIARIAARAGIPCTDGFRRVSEILELFRDVLRQSQRNVVRPDLVVLIGAVLDLRHVELELVLILGEREDDGRLGAFELAGQISRRGTADEAFLGADADGSGAARLQIVEESLADRLEVHVCHFSGSPHASVSWTRLGLFHLGSRTGTRLRRGARLDCHHRARQIVEQEHDLPLEVAYARAFLLREALEDRAPRQVGAESKDGVGKIRQRLPEQVGRALGEVRPAGEEDRGRVVARV